MFEVHCKQCGAVSAMGSRFCESCGSPLTGPDPQQQRPAPPPPAPPPPPIFQTPPPPMAQPIGTQPPQSQKAIASLILGIVGFVFCGPFTAIPGMIVGKSELNAIRDGRSPASNESLAKAGFYVSMGVTILYVLIFIATIALGFLPFILALLGRS